MAARGHKSALLVNFQPYYCNFNNNTTATLIYQNLAVVVHKWKMSSNRTKAIGTIMKLFVYMCGIIRAINLPFVCLNLEKNNNNT